MQKIQEIVAQRAKSDVYFARVNHEQRLNLARQVLAKETSEDMPLLSFDQWCNENKQYKMFQNGE